MTVSSGRPEPFVPYRVNHRLHLTLSLMTFGLWAVLFWWWWTLYVHHRNQRAYWQHLLRRARYEAVQLHRQRLAERHQRLFIAPARRD